MSPKKSQHARLPMPVGATLLRHLPLALWSTRKLDMLQRSTGIVAKNWLPTVELCGAMNGPLQQYMPLVSSSVRVRLADQLQASLARDHADMWANS